MNPDDNTTPAPSPKTRKAKEVYNRVIVQLADANASSFTILEDLGKVTTLKAQQVKRHHEKTGKTNLAVIYWVG